MERRLLNIREASGLLGLSVHTIYSWISQKRSIPYVKLGKAVRFDTRDLDKWIERMKVHPIEEDEG